MHAPPRPARDLRVSRLPLLLAYLLVLLGTPFGEAGFRWMHLASAHSDALELAAGARTAAGGTTLAPARRAEREHAVDSRLRGDGAIPALPAHAQEHAAEHAHPAPHGRAAAHEHAATHPHTHHERVEPQGPSVAPDQPHEHGGTVHTHTQHPVPGAELLSGSLSKFYLAPPTTSAPSAGAGPRHARPVRPAPHQVAARIDTPPPRLPG